MASSSQVIKLVRDRVDDQFTLGELWLPKYRLYTLENTKKIIPEGTFRVIKNYSPRFKTYLPLVIVQGRTGIRFHAGNHHWDTEGCILVGEDRDIKAGAVWNSRKALKILLDNTDKEFLLTVESKKVCKVEDTNDATE